MFTQNIYGQSSYQDKIYTFKLKNGLSVFLLPDSSEPFVNIQLVVKAGLAHQTKDFPGLIPLRTKLFFSLEEENTNLAESGVHFFADYDDVATYYGIKIHPHKTELALNSLAEQCFNPFFSDSALKKEKEDYLYQIQSLEKTGTLFINEIIETSITGSKEVQLYPGISSNDFSKKNTSQIRQELYKLNQALYTPDNCGLFIHGAIEINQTEELINKIFNQYTGKNQKNLEAAFIPQKNGENFVLLSDNFSEDLNQIIIQFTSNTPEESLAIDLLLQLLTEKENLGLKNIVSEIKKHIVSDHYIFANNAKFLGNHRLVIQGLSNISDNPVTQLNEIKESIKNYLLNRLNSENLENSFKRMQRQKEYSISSKNYMENLAKNYGEDVFLYTKEYNLEDTKQIALNILENQPFCYILMNNQNFKNHSKQFESSGFIVIEEDEYLNQKNKIDNIKINPAEQNTQSSLDKDQNSFSPIQKFVETQLELFRTTTLSNDIPLIYKHSPIQTDSVIRLEISGGEKNSFLGIRGMETLILRIATENMLMVMKEYFNSDVIFSMPDITCETGLDSSSITINCHSQDLYRCLQAAIGSIVFGDVTPSIADETVYNMEREYKFLAADTSFQMYCNFMQEFYSNSKEKKLFNLKNTLLSNLNFDHIKNAYTQILDASRYKIIIVTSQDFDNVAKHTQEYFGILQKHPKIKITTKGEANEDTSNTVPKIKSFISLHRIFTTDIPADQAGERPAKLIPTTEFNDPVHYYSNAPSDIEEIPLYNSLLFELGHRIEKATGLDVKIKTASADSLFGGIQILSVPQLLDIDKVLQKTATQLAEDMESSNAQDIILDAKIKWQLNTLGDISNNIIVSKLIAFGIATTGNEKQYLEDCAIIDKATVLDYSKVMKKYLLEFPSACIYSESRLK